MNHFWSISSTKYDVEVRIVLDIMKSVPNSKATYCIDSCDVMKSGEQVKVHNFWLFWNNCTL